MRYIVPLLAGYLLLMPRASSAQEKLQYRWSFNSINGTSGQQLLPVSQDDYFHLKEDHTFLYELEAKNDLRAEGHWKANDSILTLNYSAPTDTTRHYLIKTLTDSLLIINEAKVDFSFKRPPA